MNIYRIQAEYLKILVNKKRYIYSVLENTVAVGDGNMLYLVPKESFFLSTDETVLKREQFNVRYILKGEPDAADARLTQEMRLTDDGRTIVRLASEKEEAWINQGYLKNFDKNCSFRITNYKSPVFVYEGIRLAGIILPVNAGCGKKGGEEA